jgi:hypothetical protein
MSDTYGGRFMKGTDLAGRPHLVTIERAVFEKLPDFNNPNQQNDRLILSFAETGKDVAVNATSARVLMAAFGEDERAYLGKQVVLFPQSVNVGGQLRESVMIRIPRVRPVAPPPAPAAPPPVDPTTAGDFDADETIPF